MVSGVRWFQDIIKGHIGIDRNVRQSCSQYPSALSSLKGCKVWFLKVIFINYQFHPRPQCFVLNRLDIGINWFVCMLCLCYEVASSEGVCHEKGCISVLGQLTYRLHNIYM